MTFTSGRQALLVESRSRSNHYMGAIDRGKYPIQCRKDFDQFIGGPITELVKFLEGSFMGVFASGMARPKGWPRQILRTSRGDAWIKGDVWVVAFQMNVTGKKWSHFYTSTFKTEPMRKRKALVYKKVGQCDGNRYFPIARCDLDDSGIIKKVDVSWCEEVIRVRKWEAETYGRPL